MNTDKNSRWHILLRGVGCAWIFLSMMTGAAWAQQNHDWQNSMSLAQLSMLYPHIKITPDKEHSIALNKIIQLQLEKVQLKEAVETIAQKAGLQFSYSSQRITSYKRFTLQAKQITVEDALGRLLRDTDWWFSVLPSGHLILVERQPQKLQAIQQTITGTVVDASTGETLPGVNVIVKGTKIGTATGAGGTYELQVHSLQDTLMFSFIGFRTLHIPMDGRNVINVEMQPRTISGEELVVVGYGTQKRADLTSSIAQIDGADLAQRPTADLATSLQGAIAGLNIVRNSGNVASNPDINIRGFTSINGGSPLILIDGVVGELDDINPHDVESITVLKDAAAAAIYGSRAAFGVVLVTTKDARSGDVEINYSNNFSLQTTTNSTDWLTDPYKALLLVDESFRTKNGRPYTGYSPQDYKEIQKRSENPSLPDVVIDKRGGRKQYIYYGNTDWWDYFFREWHPAMSHSLSVSGGTDRLSTYISGRYFKNVGILEVQKDTYTSYDFRAKLGYNISDQLTLNGAFHTNTSHNLRHGGSMYGWDTPFGSLIWVHALPFYVPKNPDGTATFRTELNNYTIGDGAYASLLYGKSKQMIDRREYGITMEAIFTPIDNLDINASYSNRLNFYEETQRSVEAPWSIYPGVIEYLGHDELQEVRGNSNYKSISVNATYQHSLGLHHFKEMIGFSQEHLVYESIDARKKNLISDNLNGLDLGSSDPQAFGSAYEWAVQGYFFRLNYDYDNRYLLQISGRYDGSSRFPKESRWGFFPSISAGWLVSNEAFFEGLRDEINLLKVRASYGSLGNQDISPYAYSPTLSQGTFSYLIDGQRLQYVGLPGLNPVNITWEEVKTINLGLDIAAFHNKLSAHVDLFQRETLGMLTKGRTLPAVLGTESPKRNAADLRTRGFELRVTYQNTFNVGNKPLHFVLGASLANQVTTITRFDNPNKFLGDYYVGQELGEIWGYHIEGLFQSKEEIANHADQQRVNGDILSSPGKYGHLLPGDLKYADLNGDGVIGPGNKTLENPGDRRIIGNTAPKFPYSFSLQVDWNNIDFSVFFQGIGHKDWYPDGDARSFWAMYGRPYNSFIRKDLVDEIWTPENKDAYFPRLRGYAALGDEGSSLGTVNDRYLQNVAYLRLKNITIGYTLPQTWLQKINIERLRIYVSGENLLTFSPLTDYIDPEAAGGDFTYGNASSAGNRSEALTYPFGKVYSFGINIDF